MVRPSVLLAFIAQDRFYQPIHTRSAFPLMSSEDVFADTAFLDDFDPDAAIRESLGILNDGSSAVVNNNSKKQALVNHQEENNENNSKRLKPTPLTEEAQSQFSNKEYAREALERTLETYFGYSSFRGPQLPVIQAVLEKRDCAVLWPTGFGKSLCYCIPPMHLKGKVALVISPLISLMQDQVHKLNGLDEKPIACFLGSAQNDPHMHQKAVRGEYPIVYVTPEYFNAYSFQSQLSKELIHKLCLIAIDEAHCVSEWGQGFRPDYRQIGQSLSQYAGYNIPVVALTATATERVQQDIIQSLKLRNPLVSKKSFDRSNLVIQVQKKHVASVSGTLTPLLKTLKEKGTEESTIIYAPTRALVDEVATFLQKNLPDTVKVDSYHAGMPTEERKQAHVRFLTGQTPIVVATVAFGMGIDKPDIRRVVHFAPPKTVEEYYQQIGRAGRDGLVAECILYCSDSDFQRYRSDFYLQGLSADARKATEYSMDQLRSFAMDLENCRRKSLLEYFGESPPFGDRCGTCDTCRSRETHDGDLERDFGLQARIILRAVEGLREQGYTIILKVLGGGLVESYRYRRNHTPLVVQRDIKLLREDLPRKLPTQFFRELVPALVQKGYLTEKTTSTTVSGYQRSWTVFELTRKGIDALKVMRTPIYLPVPPTVREIEKQEEKRRQRVLEELEKRGLDKTKIPDKELQDGEGDVILAYSKWYSYVDSARRSGKEGRVAKLEELLVSIQCWRSETAVKYRIAPASVLSEHLLVTIAYTTASLPPGMKMSKDSIVAAGVRAREIDGLVAILSKWNDGDSGSVKEAAAHVSPMILCEINPVKWHYAVYKPSKKTGLAVWEDSYSRFAAGESPQGIAMRPAPGKKPIQVSTVVNHIFDAMSFGRSVDLKRLADFHDLPNKNEWEAFEAAALSTGMDVCGDPDTSGANGDRFTMTEYLRPIVGSVVVDTPFAERSDADKEAFSRWCGLLRWFIALKRANFEPSFR